MNELSKRQREILTVSIKIIAEEGIQNLTIKNISQAMGFTEAALYRHCKNKHEILLKILDLFKELSQMPDFSENTDISPIDKIELFLIDRYEKFTLNKDFAKVMFSEAIFINDKELSSKIRDIIRRHKKTIVAYLKKAKKEQLINNKLDPESVFRTIIGSMRL